MYAIENTIKQMKAFSWTPKKVKYIEDQGCCIHLFRALKSESLKGVLHDVIFLITCLATMKKPIHCTLQQTCYTLQSGLQLAGDFGGNAHRGTRCHSMQSFAGSFHSKITWAGIGLREGCNGRSVLLLFVH